MAYQDRLATWAKVWLQVFQFIHMNSDFNNHIFTVHFVFQILVTVSTTARGPRQSVQHHLSVVSVVLSMVT